MAAVVRIPVESNIATASVNVWHYRIPNVSPVAEVNEAVVQLDTFYTAIASLLQAGTWTIGSRCVTEDQTPNVIINATTGSVTTSGTAGEILSACAVLAIRSNVVGGSRRGRKYLGPLDAGVVDADGRTVGASDRTTINTAAAALLSATASGAEMGIWSRQLSVFTLATGVGTGARVGTQRRRLS
mgnify:CR=1 FL=1